MIKSNTKKAADNIRAYIVNNFNFDNYDDGTTAAPEGWSAISAFILATFRNEYINEWNAARYTEQANFCEWCAGLPSVLDTCYFYNRSAVNDLAAILEETPKEAARYSERDAETMLTKLIYRELKKEEEKRK